MKQSTLKRIYGYKEDDGLIRSINPPTYQLKITNKGSEPEKWVLFGFNKFWTGIPNFGSDPNIEITPTCSDLTYPQFLAQSMEQPFVTMLIKILPLDDSISTIPIVFEYNMFDMGGDTLYIPSYTNAFMSDYQQFKQVTMNLRRKITGHSYFSGTLDGGKSIIVSIFPAEKASLSDVLDIVAAAIKVKFIKKITSKMVGLFNKFHLKISSILKKSKKKEIAPLISDKPTVTGKGESISSVEPETKDEHENG